MNRPSKKPRVGIYLPPHQTQVDGTTLFGHPSIPIGAPFLVFFEGLGPSQKLVIDWIPKTKHDFKASATGAGDLYCGTDGISNNQASAPFTMGSNVLEIRAFVFHDDGTPAYCLVIDIHPIKV